MVAVLVSAAVPPKFPKTPATNPPQCCTRVSHIGPGSAMNKASNRSESGPRISTRRGFSRRNLLRAAGIALALPLLDAMSPTIARAAVANATLPAKPRRMLAICNNLGLLPDQFFPKESGKNYALSPYLQILNDFKNDFTVFSGVSHPDVDGGHPADNCFLTAAPH